MSILPFHRECASTPEQACGACTAEAVRSKCAGETVTGYLILVSAAMQGRQP